MSASSQHLTVFQQRCDQCGECRSACPHNALKVGTDYLYVDWRKCDGCLKCVEVCDRNAIVSRVVPLRSSSVQSTVPLADVTNVIVGSRAEAKAVRKAAERAAKEKSAVRPAKRVAAKRAPARSASTAPPTAGEAARSTEPGHLPYDREAPVTSALPAALLAGARAVVPLRRPAEKPARDLDSSGAPVGWTLLDAGAVLAIVLVTLLAKNAVLALPQVQLMPQLGKMAVRAVVLCAYYIAQIAAFGWLAGRHGVQAMEGFGLRRSEAARSTGHPSVLGSIGLVLAIFVGCEVVSIGYGLTMGAAGILQPERLSSDLAGVFGGGTIGIVLAFGLVAVAAPFAEEIAFRAIVLPAVGDRWGTWTGIAVSAVLYATYHANLWLFVPTLVLGVALGWLAWTRRSLWPAVALHVLYNAAAVAAAFAATK